MMKFQTDQRATNVLVKNTYFKYQDIYITKWTSFNGQIHNEINHIVRHAESNSNQSLLTKIRTRLSVNSVNSKTSKVDRFDRYCKNI